MATLSAMTDIQLCEQLDQQHMHSVFSQPLLVDFLNRITPLERGVIYSRLVNARIEQMDIDDLQSFVHETMYSEMSDSPQVYAASDVTDYGIESTMHGEIIAILRNRRASAGVVAPNPDDVGEEV